MPDPSQRLVWVRQEHAEGCAIATLAMLLGRTYADVLREVNAGPDHGHSKDWDREGVTHYTIDWIIARSGGFLQRRYPTWGWVMEPFTDRHYASVRQPSGRSHFVVVGAEGEVLDPLREGVFSLEDWPEVNHITGVVWP